MPKWELHGVVFGDLVGSDRAIYHRQLADGTLLVARVRNAEGRPMCDEIVARFPNGARDFGRELAITELERVINDAWTYIDAKTGEPSAIFALSEIPVAAPLRGSRSRESQWTDTRLAHLVRDLESDHTEHWHLTRSYLRQRANEAVRRGIAEVAAHGPPKRWRLTSYGVGLLPDEEC
jgi:hypothetical protein